MKKQLVLISFILALTAGGALAQEATLHSVAPREYVQKMVNGHLTWVIDTASLDPVMFTTQREKDSIRVLDFQDLLAMDHTWLARDVWRTGSTDGLYRRNRIARNEAKLHQADSAFTVRYGNRYTA